MERQLKGGETVQTDLALNEARQLGEQTRSGECRPHTEKMARAFLGSGSVVVGGTGKLGASISSGAARSSGPDFGR